MKTEEADKKLEQIESLAREIEQDEELYSIDERYRTTAKWIDTNINNAN